MELKKWTRERYTVEERPDGLNGLSWFAIMEGGEVADYIYPGSHWDQVRIIDALDAGEDVNGWDNGAGNPVKI